MFFLVVMIVKYLFTRYFSDTSCFQKTSTQQCFDKYSDSEFGIENIEFNPTNPNDTSVNVALDPNGLLRAGTHIKILEYITSHTPMKEKDDIFLESTEEFETRCFLHIYKELKTPDGNKLDADSLLRLLKQRNIHQNIKCGS